MKIRPPLPASIMRDFEARVLGIVKMQPGRQCRWYISDVIEDPDDKDVYFLVRVMDDIYAVDSEFKIYTCHPAKRGPQINRTFSIVDHSLIVSEGHDIIFRNEAREIRRAIKRWIKREAEKH